MSKPDSKWQPWLETCRHLRRSSALFQVAVSALALLCSITLVSAVLSLSSSSQGAPSVPRSVLNISPSSAARFKLTNDDFQKYPPSKTRQSDLFISVKTTKQFHRSRLELILQTWFQLAKSETWFFTDQADDEVDAKSGGHLRVTNCPSTHNRQALCCKMGAEFDAFLESGRRWFCHFDDDNYVNIPALVKKLREFDHRQDWYLGKPSISEPLEILDRGDNIQGKLSFWFATGGAGFCLSQSLARKMRPMAAEGRFEAVGDKIRLPDDVTMGYISEHLLKTPLTVVDEFHSHLEPQRFLGEPFNKDFKLDEQISFSYSKYGDEMNVVTVTGFEEEQDPTRFKSLHCQLFPGFSWCPKKSGL